MISSEQAYKPAIKTLSLKFATTTTITSRPLNLCKTVSTPVGTNMVNNGKTYKYWEPLNYKLNLFVIKLLKMALVMFIIE